MKAALSQLTVELTPQKSSSTSDTAKAFMKWMFQFSLKKQKYKDFLFLTLFPKATSYSNDTK